MKKKNLKVKPSIENVIDRKASIFRNNQYGGRFDNPDLVGLQKQEQIRQLQMMKRATMTEAMFNDPDRTRFRPQPALPLGFETPQSVRDIDVDKDLMMRMEQQLNEYAERQRQLQDFDRRDADEMLSVVSSQQLPQGVQQFMIDTPSQAYQSEPSSTSLTDGELPPSQTMDETPPNVVEQQPASSSSSSQIPPPMPTVEDSRIWDNIKELNPNLTMNEQLQAFRILNGVKDKTSRICANNITSMAETVEKLTELELVSASDYEEFWGLKVMSKETKGKERKDEVREEIGKW